MSIRNNYYVTKRKGWFNGIYDHVVRSRNHDDAIICAGPDHCCDLVANAFNTIDSIKRKTSDE